MTNPLRLRPSPAHLPQTAGAHSVIGSRGFAQRAMSWVLAAVIALPAPALAQEAAPAVAIPVIPQGSLSDPLAPQRNTALDTYGALPGLTSQPVRLLSAARPLSEIQKQLEPTLGVRVMLTEGAADLVVSGEFSGADGMSFLRDLAAKARLEWAIGREGIYLAPEGRARGVVFNAPSPTIALRTAALANREFEELGSGIRVVGRKDEITVTGIPTWVNQVAAPRIASLADFVQRTSAQLAARKAAEERDRLRAETAGANAAQTAGSSAPQVSEPLSLMVFRLNNAYVDDKRLSVGSNSLIIPGVATLFRQFTGIRATNAGAQGGGQDAGTTRMNRLEPLAGGRTGRRADPAEMADEADEAERMSRAQGNTPANRPAVIADSRMNALIVRDRAAMLEPYKALVAVLDQSTDMVQLDAFVIDIRTSRLDEFGFGLSWAGSGSVNSSVTSTGGAVPSGANVILQAARGIQLLAQIRALESTGDSEILTVPSVVTLNNLEATFSARQNFFVKVAGNQDASLTRVTAETLLKVTPLVSNAAGSEGNDRRIRLLISIQDGSVDTASSVEGLPRTLENQISTQAVVRGGDTLVIGGQVVRKSVKRVSGLPFIRDLPVLGALTNSRSDEMEQFIRLYVVRPRLLGDDSTALNLPVMPGQADPLANGILERVPSLIRGTGLSPRSPDASRPSGLSRPAAAEPLVVPVAPQRMPDPDPPRAPAPDKGDGNATPKDASAGAAGGITVHSSTEKNDVDPNWNPDDPVWRAPGGPPRRTQGGAAPSGAPRPGAGGVPGSTSRIDSSTQIRRDQDARRILEVELQKTEQAIARHERDLAQGVSGASAAIERARVDRDTLLTELARFQSPAGRSSSAAAASTNTQSNATAVQGVDAKPQAVGAPAQGGGAAAAQGIGVAAPGIGVAAQGIGKSALGIGVSAQGSSASTASRRDAPTTRRDQDARRILEEELTRSEAAIARLERESSQSREGASSMLARARADSDWIRKELSRYAAPAINRVANTSNGR